VRLWEAEERRLGLPELGEEYVVPAGVEFPLLATGGPASDGAIDEVTQSIRSKVYALLACTGFDGGPALSGRELAVMEKIKFYLTLKVGEVWTEVKNALAAGGVEPTATDAELLDNGIAANRKHVTTLQQTQRSLLDIELDKERKHLESTYADITFRHYAEEKDARRKADKMDRTSQYPKMVAARQRQRQQLAASRQLCESVPGEGAEHHEGEMLQESLNSTVFPSQLVLSGLLQPGADGSVADDTIVFDAAIEAS